MFPKVMKAAAGPHDPGPGKNFDEIPPEPMAAILSRGSDDGYDSSGDDLELYHHISSVWQASPLVIDSDFFVRRKEVFLMKSQNMSSK